MGHAESGHWQVCYGPERELNSRSGTFEMEPHSVHLPSWASGDLTLRQQVLSPSFSLAINLLYLRSQDEPQNTFAFAKSTVENISCLVPVPSPVNKAHRETCVVTPPAPSMHCPRDFMVEATRKKSSVTHPSKSHMPWYLPAKHPYVQSLKHSLCPGLPPTLNKYCGLWCKNEEEDFHAMKKLKQSYKRKIPPPKIKLSNPHYDEWTRPAPSVSSRRARASGVKAHRDRVIKSFCYVVQADTVQYHPMWLPQWTSIVSSQF